MSTDATLRPVGVLDELRRIVPTEQVEPHYDVEQSLGGSFVVEPAAEEELVELLQWANDRHAIVYTRHPRSGDADLAGPRPRIYLRGHRMARMTDVDVVSGTATVQSGLAMGELHRLLGERGYTTGFPTRAWRQISVGAMLSSCLDAHWGPPYGHRESEVLSLGVVLPDGTPAASRTAPRRAVGPDFDRLFLGSRGAYGIIHRVTLRIYASSARVHLAYAARTVGEAVDAVRRGFERGLEPRSVEILTPTADRSWGRKQVGLSDEAPVLLLAEPWGRQSGVTAGALDEHLGGALTRLDPPAGWSLHEGLLPPPREWAAPVVGVPWGTLEALAGDLGEDAPAGLWIVRMSRHGAYVSLAAGVGGKAADLARARLAAFRRPLAGPWTPLHRALKARLDPRGVLNPEAPPEGLEEAAP